MAQIQAGHNYTSTGANSLVTASNLNQHVNNAQLASGAISEQVPNSVTADTDLLLISKSGSLFSQTKLQFTDTINSDTINVNDLSVDTAEIDTLTISQTPNGASDRLFDIGYAQIHTNNSSGLYIGYNAGGFASAPVGVSALTQVIVTSPTFYFSSPSSSLATATFDKSNLYVNSYAGVGGNLYVSDNATINGDLTVNGTLTVASANPTLKASGSWTWNGASMVERRTPFNCSITRLGVGYYKITFTTAMSSANYVISAMGGQATGNVIASVGEVGTRTSVECYLQSQNKAFSSSGGAVDNSIDILIFD